MYEIPHRFRCYHDPKQERLITANLLLGIFNNCKSFKNLKYKDAIIIGIERGLINYTIKSSLM